METLSSLIKTLVQDTKWLRMPREQSLLKIIRNKCFPNWCTHVVVVLRSTPSINPIDSFCGPGATQFQKGAPISVYNSHQAPNKDL